MKQRYYKYGTLACLLALGFSCHVGTVQADNSLIFDDSKYETRTMNVNGDTITFRAYEKIPYVAKPVDEEYQYINIYVPEAYYHEKAQGTYTKDTAPIFLPNSVGGYRPSKGATPTLDKEGNPNASLYALSRGLVVAAPATRGRTNTNETGEYIGKAPAVIVDLKAAVAYLHSNDERMAGDANRIISNGTSAGGAVSLLLGATGNNIEYAPYLNELGAAKGRTDIYAVSAYCPITYLDHADMAYEWSYNGVNSYTGMPDLGGQMEPPDPALGLNASGQSMPKGKTIALDADAMAYSQLLKKNFPAYVNSLELKDSKGQTLMLQPDGTGSFMTYAKSFIIDSANKANAEGTDINTADFLVYDTQHPETIVDINWLAYNTSVGRMKAPGAFDARNNSTGENNLFGTTTIDNQHFTEFAAIHGDGTSVAANEIIRLMNPLNYIQPYKMAPVDMTATSSDTSKYWRIRYGEIDNNTSMAVPLIVATRLANYGYEVDFAMPWGVAHAGDYDLPDLFDWIDEIV